ncbi:MAG TPA: hypothetical protein VH374_26265 [Polyangia bacterium]|nr:hypothetical protein [Polyangia bacterium]
MPSEVVAANATPQTGGSAEVIFHQFYDTQPFTTASTLSNTYFATPNVDKSITNLPQGGQLPAPQLFQIYDVCFDILPTVPVSTSAGVAGILTDMALMLFGSAQRPRWLLNISDKNYGPYSLTTLHGTGGPTGWTSGAEVATIQFAKNDPSPGWNYLGQQTIKQQVNFFVSVIWAATATIQDVVPQTRLSLFGVLNRATL